MTLLEIRDLRVMFAAEDRTVRAIDTIDLDVFEGEVLGLVGETGSGKTILGRAIVHLLSHGTQHLGSIRYRGREILGIPDSEMLGIRGREISMVLQNPAGSLDPTMRVLDQVAEVFAIHGGEPWGQARARAGRLLEDMGIPADRHREYPHQMSGGMGQRVALAMGLALEPSLLIADEPTKGLDPKARDTVLKLLRRAVEGGTTLIVITHDLDAARAICDRVAVMYAAEVVELGATDEVLESPRHPYTRDLVRARPAMGMRSVPGDSPALSALPAGCRYHPRCAHRFDRCRTEHPELVEVNGETVRCLLCKGGRP